MGPGGKLISYRPLALSAAEVEEVEEDGGGLFLLSFSAEAGIELELTDDDAGVVVEVAAADALVARLDTADEGDKKPLIRLLPADCCCTFSLILRSARADRDGLATSMAATPVLKTSRWNQFKVY